MNSHCLKLYLTNYYSTSFISSNVGNFFWNWILKDCIKVQEKKKKIIVLCSRCTMTAKKCTKMRDAHAKLLFCSYHPTAFLAFSMLSPFSLLKLPNIVMVSSKAKLLWPPSLPSKTLRRNPSGNWVISVFSGQKPCTRII